MVATSVDKYFDDCPLLRIRGDDRAAGAAKWMQQTMREEVAKGWLTWDRGGVCFLNPDGHRCGHQETLF